MGRTPNPILSIWLPYWTPHSLISSILIQIGCTQSSSILEREVSHLPKSNFYVFSSEISFSMKTHDLPFLFSIVSLHIGHERVKPPWANELSLGKLTKLSKSHVYVARHTGKLILTYFLTIIQALSIQRINTPWQVHTEFSLRGGTSSRALSKGMIEERANSLWIGKTIHTWVMVWTLAMEAWTSRMTGNYFIVTSAIPTLPEIGQGTQC